jgi:hypothetical protein
MRDVPLALRRRAAAIDDAAQAREAAALEAGQMLAITIAGYLASEFRALADEIERTGE